MWSNILLCNLPNVVSSWWSMHTVRHTACKKQNPSSLMGITWWHNLYTNWGNLSHGILMLQKHMYPCYTPNYGFNLYYLFTNAWQTGTRGENNCIYFFIFICGSVVALSSPDVLIDQLPCSVGTVGCDVGVNMSTAYLLFSEIISILAFT